MDKPTFFEWVKGFWMKNKVFLVGLAGAVFLTVQQFELKANVDWKVIALAVGLSGISYIAKNWRGQSTSMIGVLGNAAFAFTTVYETGHFTLSQFFIQVILVFGFAASPDPKSRGYEHTETIKNAKIEGEIITPASLTNTNIKKEAEKIKAS